MSADVQPIPHSEESEKLVLGALLADTHAVMPILQMEANLSPADFYHPAHRTILEAVLGIFDTRGGYVDPMLLTGKLRDLGVLEECGGMDYLMALVDECPLVSTRMSDIRHHMDVVKNKSLIRSAIDVCQDIVKRAYQSPDDGRSFLLSAPAAFYEALPKRKDQESIEDILDSAISRWEETALLPEGTEIPLIGLESGIPDLDKLTDGFQPGLNLLAGRPSAGKTSLEGCIATWNASQGIPVARIADDMSKRMVVLRDACREAGVSLAALNKGFAKKSHIQKLKEAKKRLLEYPMYIEAGMYDVREICTWARLMKAKHDIQLLTIDYIQKVTAPHLGPRVGEHEVMSDVAARLKALSFELDIPVLALAQFNREGERNSSKKPKLSDLRGSGTLEQEASLAIFLYKSPDYEDYPMEGEFTEKKRRAVVAEVAKQQNGETGEVCCWLHGPYFNLVQADPDWGRY